MSINIRCLALRIRSILKCSMRKALRKADAIYDAYILWEARHLGETRQEKNGPYLEKEFLFRGYVPRDSFKKKPGFNYIESNQAINGTYYIYPRRCTVGCYVKHWNKYPNAYTFHKEVGIPGYTRVDWDYAL